MSHKFRKRETAELPPPGQDDEDLPETSAEEDLQETADTISPDVAQKAWEYIEKQKLQDVEITATLYRIKPEGGRRQCGRWKNQIPDEHNIGIVHGSGSYELILTWPPRGIKKYRFELDRYYDTLKQEAEMTGAVPALGRVQYQQNAPQTALPVKTNGNQTLEIIQALVPLLRPQQNDNQFSQMLQMYQMMNFVMKKSLMDSTEFFAQMQQKFLDQADNQGEGEAGMNGQAVQVEEKKSFIEQALPYIMPFIEKLTSGNPGERAMATGLVNSIPAVKEIITDPKHKSDCKSLITYLDKNLPAGKTDEILKALKVDRGMYA